ncbi:VWA domain-containing protein, partial [Salinispira pacifica]
RDDRGPIVLCVDTSGSMAGLPERVAKAISLAVLKTAVREGRRAYLISFSDRIETIEITDPGESLESLIEFLRRSFYGGTDLRPAIDRAIEVTARPEYANADILVVSDFRVPKILDRHVRRIKERQRTAGTGFYSLTVNRSPVLDTFNIFDRSWLYDISNPENRGIPIRSLTSL